MQTRVAQLARLDGVAQAELVRAGELTPGDLLAAARQRIATANPTIRAVVSHHDPAPVSGPFAGVPFLVKDLLPFPGQPCTYGSRLLAHHVPPATPPFAQRIAAAGLAAIGRTATSEFGLLGSTEALLYGAPTRNPWNLELSAAGSSGGSAAAVAAGMVPLAHASDGGGSIRIPASVCGLFGFKPSRGRTVPATPGGGDFDTLLSDGVVSRSVRDTALFLSCVEGSTLPAMGHVTGAASRRLRIGVHATTLMGSQPDAEVLRALDEAAALCRELGHEVVPAPAPAVDGPALSDAFFTLGGITLAGLMQMMTPMLGRPPGEDELEPFTLELIATAVARGADVLPAARRTFAACTAAYLEAVAPFDVLLTPTLAVRPWPIGWLAPTLPRAELLARTERAVGYTPIHNIAGAPAMSVPLHWTPDGLPIGIHFAAAPGADALLLALAYELEAARPWKDRWAPHAVAR